MDPVRHDELLAAIRDNPEEGANLGVLGDYLEENGLPGANLARAGMVARQHGMQELYREDGIHNIRNPEIGDGRGRFWLHQNRDEATPGNLTFETVERTNPTVGIKSPVYLKVAHHPFNRPDESIEYRVPVLSKRHLAELTSDLHPQLRRVLSDLTDEYLPDDHAEQMHRRRSHARRLSRKTN